MGHIHLGRLPKTRPWNAVIDLLRAGASTADIAKATAKAAENSLAPAASDPAIRHAFWLLTQLPLAARSTDFAARLKELKIDVGSAPSLLSLTAAFQESIDARSRDAKGKTDLGGMALLAATEAFTALLAADLPGLFGTTSEDARYALGKLAAPDRFAKLSREFFVRLVNRNLEYFISRAIADYIGPGRGRSFTRWALPSSVERLFEMFVAMPSYRPARFSNFTCQHREQHPGRGQNGRRCERKIAGYLARRELNLMTRVRVTTPKSLGC